MRIESKLKDLISFFFIGVKFILQNNLNAMQFAIIIYAVNFKKKF